MKNAEKIYIVTKIKAFGIGVEKYLKTAEGWKGGGKGRLRRFVIVSYSNHI